jgi:hypothetical protein
VTLRIVAVVKQTHLARAQKTQRRSALNETNFTHCPASRRSHSLLRHHCVN